MEKALTLGKTNIKEPQNWIDIYNSQSHENLPNLFEVLATQPDYQSGILLITMTYVVCGQQSLINAFTNVNPPQVFINISILTFQSLSTIELANISSESELLLHLRSFWNPKSQDTLLLVTCNMLSCSMKYEISLHFLNSSRRINHFQFICSKERAQYKSMNAEPKHVILVCLLQRSEKKDSANTPEVIVDFDNEWQHYYIDAIEKGSSLGIPGDKNCIFSH